MKRDLKYFRDKLTALRNATDDLLREMEHTTSKPSPRKRQKPDDFVKYEMMFNKKKRKPR